MRRLHAQWDALRVLYVRVAWMCLVCYWPLASQSLESGANWPPASATELQIVPGARPREAIKSKDHAALPPEPRNKGLSLAPGAFRPIKRRRRADGDHRIAAARHAAAAGHAQPCSAA